MTPLAILAIVATAAALYQRHRVRCLAADLRMVSAELDAAHVAGARLVRRARILIHQSSTLQDERDGLAAQLEQARAELAALRDGLDRRDAQATLLGDRLAGLEAACEQAISGRAEIARACADVAAFAAREMERAERRRADQGPDDLSALAEVALPGAISELRSRRAAAPAAPDVSADSAVPETIP